jgi:hypothetical protein
MVSYQGDLGALDVIQDGFNKWIKVYNDLGSAVTNGDVYFLDWHRDADSRTVATYPTLVACATTAVQRQVVVVNNAPLGLTTIADAAFGYVQVAGYCPKVKCASTVAIADFLEAVNASQQAADDGTTQTADSFAIADTDEDTVAGFCAAMMFGTTALIG